MAIDELPKSFYKYFNRLIELLFTPKAAFTIIFDLKSAKISSALIFAFVSILLSYGLLLIASSPLILDIEIKWAFLFKQATLIPIQIVVFVPILSAILHIFVKFFKGQGKIKGSVVLVLYSYALAPYAAFFLVVFLIIEKLLGYPISLFPPKDLGLRTTEFFIEIVILFYGCYMLARGVEVCHKVNFVRAVFIILSLAIIAVLSGYGLTSIIYRFNS
ncbi:YIP1 family protein [Candidatus Parcubacteria bacterium]|nr:YIP1 family protein [Candidatus Parcubacteria bacterium]